MHASDISVCISETNLPSHDVQQRSPSDPPRSSCFFFERVVRTNTNNSCAGFQTSICLHTNTCAGFPKSICLQTNICSGFKKSIFLQTNVCAEFEKSICLQTNICAKFEKSNCLRTNIFLVVFQGWNLC